MDNIRIEGGDLSSLLDDLGASAEAIVQAASEQSAKKVAAKVARTLRASSPSGHSGKYRKGWKSKKMDHGEYVVYNESAPGLTHLLENGHDVIRNGMKVGRASAHPHIQQAEQDGIKEFEEEVRKEVERRLSEI